MPKGDSLLISTIHEKNSAFTKEVPGLQWAWDSTSLGLLKECPWKYYLSMIEGHQQDGNVHLTFGILMHTALEFYHKARAIGVEYEDAVRKAVRITLQNSGEYITRTKCLGCDAEWETTLEPRSCPACGCTETEDINEFRPWQSTDKYKNRENLIRTLVWYLDHYKSDPVQTVTLASGKAAAELSFKLELDLTHPGGEPYILCGHLDRVGDFNSQRWVTDAKSTKSQLGDNYFGQYTPDNQMSLYATAGQVVFGEHVHGVLVDAMQVAVNFSRFQRGFARRSKETLEEWIEDTKEWIGVAEHYAHRQHWPMNDKACHHYGGCEFREICSKSPSVRQRFLKTSFKQRVWNPLEER
jgi:hypothetical protein